MSTTKTREEWLNVLSEYETAGDLEGANKIRVALDMEPIQSGGSPWSQRASVDTSRGPDAQFLAAQNYDPNATRFGPDNFIINNTLHNPPGFDSGDLAQFGRPVAEGLGAVTGGIVGLAGGAPTGPGAIATSMLGAGVGGETAGQLYDLGMQYFGGAEDTRGFTETAKDTGLGIAFNSMGTPQFRNPMEYINSAKNTALDPARKVKQEVSRRGGFLTAGQLGSNTSARLEAGLESDPFSGTIIQKQRDNTSRIFGDMVDESTPLATSKDAAGDSITQGMEKNIDWSKAVVSDAYRDFDNILESLGSDRLNRISMDALKNVSKEYKELVARDAKFGEMVYSDPDLKSAINAIDEMIENQLRNSQMGMSGYGGRELVEKPTYEVIKQLRSIIGNKVNDAFYQGGEKQGLKKLYAILTDDLDSGALEIGGEAALNARKTADRLNTSLQTDLKMIDPVFKHAENPAKVYSLIETSLISNPRLASETKTAMGQEQWSRFVDTWIKNASKQKPGSAIIGEEVSANSLLTALQKLKQQSPEGYALLADGREGALDVIELLASGMRKGDQFMNRSRTGTAIGTQQIAAEASATATGALIGFATGQNPTGPLLVGGTALVMRAAIPKLIAKTLTSPTIAKALLAVKAKHGDNLPIGADLARAMLAAGANKDEIKDIFYGPKR